MKYLGVDFGRQRLGLAYSLDGVVSHRFSDGHVQDSCLSYRLRKEAWQLLHKLQRTLGGVDCIVVGLPTNREGKAGAYAQEVISFGTWLQEKLEVKVDFHDEALSTQEALEHMLMAGIKKKERSQKIHGFAAQVILQDYLDRLNEQEST